MKTDLQRIDQTLELIAQGQLDPLDAARRLLNLPAEIPSASQSDPSKINRPLDQPHRSQRQPLDQLVRTLGVPPPEIENDWRLQIQSLAHDWEQIHGVPLPPLDLNDLWVDADNRLSLGNRLRSSRPHEANHLVQETTPDQTPAVAAMASLQPTGASPSRQEPAISLPSGRRNRPVATTLVTAAAAVLLGSSYFFFASDQQRNTALDAEPTRPVPRRPMATPSEPANWQLGKPPELANHSSPAAPQRPLPTTNRPEAGADIGQLMADQDLLSERLSGPASADDLLVIEPIHPSADPVSGDQASNSEASNSEAPSLEPVLTGDDNPPGAPPSPSDAPELRPTLPVTTNAIHLPPLPASGQPRSPQTLLALPVSEIRWEFPLPTALALQSLTQHRWDLVDTADGVRIASLRTVEHGLEFSWDDLAASSPAARQVPAGRLHLTSPTLPTPQILWLRPQLQSAPFRFQFDNAQMSATWPLAGPAVFASGELAVEVDVPDTVELTWVEPLEPHNLRRSTGLLQWKLADAEMPLIACRMELRVAGNLTLKVRSAAQLDPSLPWQSYSPEQLSKASDRTTATLNRLLAQQSELARQYTAATSSGRRLLKPAKDTVDQNVQRLQTLLQQLQRLIALQTIIAEQAKLRFKLTTQWPDQRQTILELTEDRE